MVSPSCFDVRPTVISGKDVGGQLGPVGRDWLWRRNGCSQGGRFATEILERMVRDRAGVTVWRLLVEEMLRVTVLGVRVVRVAGVAVIGMSESGVVLG